MNRRKKSTLTFKRLLFLTLVLVGTCAGIWYFLIRPQSREAIQLQPLPEGFYSHGIDISHHQGEIDWRTFFSHMDTTISFIYCKVTEGTHFVDHRWNENYRQLREHGMKYGAYHFFTPDSSAELQAHHFLSHYSPSKKELPPVLDAEVDASTDERLIQGMKKWLQLVERKSGVRPIIYTSYSMYRDKMKGKFSGYEFWIASYNPDHTRVQDSAIIHWQYSDRGTVPGIDGMVDLNFSKKQFGIPIDRAQ